MFVMRTTQMPTLPKLLELERIIIVDETGPTFTSGVGNRKASVVGESLKGPFGPYMPGGSGEILSVFVGDPARMDRISQGGYDMSTNAQDGSAVAFDGNMWAELKGKKFGGIVLQRVDTDMVKSTTTTKAFCKLTITVSSDDQTGGKTNKEIIIPAGQRFADAVIGTASAVVALSQDIRIPAGTAVAANTVYVGETVSGGPLDMAQDEATGLLSVKVDSSGVKTGGPMGATCFFVKGTSATTAGTNRIDTVIDAAIPGITSTITAVSTVDSTGAACDVDAPYVGVSAPSPDTLANRISSIYPNTIDKLLPGTEKTKDIVAVWSARNWACSSSGTLAAIRAKLWSNAKDASSCGRGRVACIAVPHATAGTVSGASSAKSAALAMQSEFSGVNADRAHISFVYGKVTAQELGKDIDVSPAGARACMITQIPEEYQASVGSPENECIQGYTDVEDAFKASPLVEGDFINLKAAGIATFVRDRDAGWWFYSDPTAVVATTYPTRVKGNRRRFADFVQDTLVTLAVPYAKKPGTTERVDAIQSGAVNFLDGLLSKDQPSLQRIAGYLVDDKTYNTKELNAQGVFIFLVAVQMLGDMDAIVWKVSVGPTVEISQVA